jgi:hypothetical protein
MPRKFFQRYLPPREKLQSNRHLQVLGDVLHDNNLWHLNRQSASLAAFIGLFCAFMPIPMQMLLAAALAIVFHANLPISVVLVWVSNPLTMPPMFFGVYKLGAMLMGLQPKRIALPGSLHEVLGDLSVIWQPLLLGSVICGLVFGTLGYVTVRIIWRVAVARQWQRRIVQRKTGKNHLS